MEGSREGSQLLRKVGRAVRLGLYVLGRLVWNMDVVEVG